MKKESKAHSCVVWPQRENDFVLPNININSTSAILLLVRFLITFKLSVLVSCAFVCIMRFNASSVRPLSHLLFYSAILSRNFIARENRKCDMACVAQLLNSRATPFQNRAALYSVQLCRENVVNADWSILVYAKKLQCATRHLTLAIFSRDKVARQNCRCDIGLTL